MLHQTRGERWTDWFPHHIHSPPPPLLTFKVEKVIWFEKCYLVKEKKQPTKNSKWALTTLHVGGIVGPTQKQCLGAGLAQGGVEGSSVLGLDVTVSGSVVQTRWWKWFLLPKMRWPDSVHCLVIYKRSNDKFDGKKKRNLMWAED